MSMPVATYTPDNCKTAFQLNWALSLFWHAPPDHCDWLVELQEATEADGVRILKHDFLKPGVSQFLVSTRPEVAPERIVWSVKGRLQHAIRRQRPKAFRRNYGLRSIGSATRQAVEQYVRSQVAHHPMADPRVQEILRAVQIHDPSVDLSAPRRSAHGVYWYNLQVCFINDGRCAEIRPEPLLRMREMIVKSAAKHAALAVGRGHRGRPYPPDSGLQCRGIACGGGAFLHEQPRLYVRDAPPLRIWILRGNIRRIRFGRNVVVVAKRPDHRHGAGGAAEVRLPPW